MNFDSLPWAIAEGFFEQKPVIFRFRQFEADFPRSSYPQRLHILWSFRSPSEEGLPSNSDSEEANQFEDRLIEAVELDNHSILSLVITGHEQREYSFHTSDPQGFIQRLSGMPQEEDRYPITIQCFSDSDWEYVHEVLSGIKPNTA